MYAVQFLYIVAFVIICIATFTEHGFSSGAIPNYLVVLVLFIIEILAIFAILKQWALLIIPFIILIVFVMGLSFLLFFFRSYVWFRDGGEPSDIYLIVISNSLLVAVYMFSLIVSIRWRKYMIGLKTVKFG